MMHTLLNSNGEVDILFIQEPWFGNIGVARDDALREGREVRGGLAIPSGMPSILPLITAKGPKL